MNQKKAPAGRDRSVGAIAEALELSVDFVLDVGVELALPVRSHRDVVTADHAVRLAERCRNNRREMFSAAPAFRWSVRKRTLESRGLYNTIASRAVERIALARRCELRRGVDEHSRAYVEVRRADVRVRLGRNLLDHSPMLITGYSDCLTDPGAMAQRIVEVGRSVGSTLSLEERMRQVDELLEAARAS